MASERIQRRIDSLLDQAEEVADCKDWREVRELAQRALTLDAENEDASAIFEMAAGELSPLVPSVPSSEVSAAPVEPPSQPTVPDHAAPDSFASGRYDREVDVHDQPNI